MDSFLQITLSNLAVASLLAVVVFVLSRWMTKPAVLHGLWVIVLLKLVTPPVVSLPIGEFGLSGDLRRAKQRPQTAEKTDPPNASVPSSQSPGIDEKPKSAKVKHFGKPSPKAAKKSAISAKPVRDQNKDLYAFEESEQIESAYRAEFDADEIAASAPFVKLERPAAREATAETNSQSASAFGSWVLGVLAVWAVGSMYVLVISLIRIVRFNRLLRHAAPAPLEMEADLKELARQLKLSRVPQLFMISAKISPVLWTTGFSTRILFPVELMKHLDAPARRTLLLHELAHYRRGDHWVRFLETFVTIVYWWNPLVRWMRRELRETEELACDAWVVATLPEARESYAYAFVKALEFLGSRGVPLPGLASGMGQFDSAKRRLCKIMTGSAPPCASFGGRLGLFAVALMLLAFWPNLGKTGEAKSQRSQRADQSKAVAEKPARRQTSAAPTVRAQAIRRLDDLVKPYSFINQEFEFQPAEDVHWCADFSPDGKLLATGSGHWTRGGLVRVWDVEKRTVVKSFREPKGTRCVDFSPDGKRLASANFSREGLVYDLETGKIALRLVGHTAMLECVDHSPDGKLIATGSNDKTVRIWNAQTGRLIRTIPAHEDRVYYVRFSKDNQTLLSGSRDDTVKHWNVQTGELIWSHTLGGDVEYAVFSPDGQTVASCSWDGTARLLDAETGNERAVFGGNQGMMLCSEFSPDGKKLATGGSDGMIRIWDVATQKTLTTLAGHTSNIYAAVFSPDGRTIASTGWDNTTRLWDLDSGNHETLVPMPTEGEDPQVTLAVAYSPDGKVVASAHEDRSIRLWDPKTANVLALLKGHDDVPSSLAFSPDGKLLASGGFDEKVLLWDIPQSLRPGAEPSPKKTLKGHTNWVFSLEFSADGKRLASGGYDKVVRIWDVAKGEEVKQLEGNMAAVRAVAFSRDGKLVASAGSDRRVRIWNLADGGLIKTILAHEAAIRDLAFSPDARQLATASEDKTVKIWNRSTGKAIHTLKHPGMVWCLAWSRDGSTIASAGLDKPFAVVSNQGAASNKIRLWDASDGTLIGNLRGHNDAITSLAFKKSGTELISGSYDKTVKSWPIRLVGIPPIVTLPDPTFKKKEHPSHVGFLPDRLVVLEGEDVVSWNLETGKRLPKKQNPPSDAVAKLRQAAERTNGEKRIQVPLTNLTATIGQGNVIGLSNGRKVTIVGLRNITDMVPLGDTGIVAIADDQGKVIVHDLVHPGWISRFERHPVPVVSLACSEDGSLLATADRNGAVRLFPTSPDVVARWVQIWGPAWQFRQAVRFNQNRDHLKVKGLRYDGSHPITVEAIVDATDIKNCVIVGDLAEAGLALRIQNRKWAFSVRGEKGFRNALSDEEIQTEQPVHLAGVFDGKTVRLFLNGKLQKQQPKLGGNYQPSPNPWTVGARFSPTLDWTGFFRGRVQGLRISRSVRYGEDFLKFPKSFANDADTLLLYHFTEGGGERVYDASGHGYHGHLEPPHWVRALQFEEKPKEARE